MRLEQSSKTSPVFKKASVPAVKLNFQDHRRWLLSVTLAAGCHLRSETFPTAITNLLPYGPVCKLCRRNTGGSECALPFWAIARSQLKNYPMASMRSLLIPTKTGIILTCNQRPQACLKLRFHGSLTDLNPPLCRLPSFPMYSHSVPRASTAPPAVAQGADTESSASWKTNPNQLAAV